MQIRASITKTHVVFLCSLCGFLYENQTAGESKGAMIEFAAAQNVLDTPGGVQDIVLADLDLDNDLDIVVLAALHQPPTPEGFALIHVLRNNGDGFAVTTTQVGPFFRLENFVHHVRVGDMTGDGLPDIAFVGSTMPLHLMINLGDAMFSEPMETALTVDTGHLVGLLGMGDLNGDGLADVAVGLPGQVGISDGLGGLAVQEFSISSNPRTLSIVELNGDDLNDIAYGSRTHINNGDGTFALVGDHGNIPTTGFAMDCEFADFDGDGDADVACPNFLTNTVSTALNNGGGIFSAATRIPVFESPIDMATGDLNGDGVLDLVVTHGDFPNGQDTDFVTILTGRGDGGFDEPFLFFSDSGRTIAIGDLDNDGVDDLVLASGLAFFGPDGVDVLFNSQLTMCGDGICNGNEDSCICPDDCGVAPLNEVTGATCDDGEDNDCDGFTDCDDPDCDGDGTCDEVDTDGDGIIDALDTDDDNDGVPDVDDPEPLNPNVCGDGNLDGCDDCAEDADGNGVPDACDLQSPAAAGAPHDILKNRYISIDPRGAAGNNPPNLHIRVMMDSSQVVDLEGTGPWWAAQPDAECISVVTTAKPVLEPDWTGCDTGHLTGCPIVPTTTYAIASEAGGRLSAEVLLDTQAKPGVKWHGDAVGFFEGDTNTWTAPQGTVNIDDAVAAIKTFQDINALNATHVSVTDLEPNLNGTQINTIVNINDVFTTILGFQGQEYPGSDLTQCP